jgi:excisionase family DNA binding protein
MKINRHLKEHIFFKDPDINISQAITGRENDKVASSSSLCHGGDRHPKKPAKRVMRHLKMIQDNPMTINEAANLAKRNCHTIHRAIMKGNLAAYRPGKTMLPPEKNLTHWIKSKQIHDFKIGKPRHTIKVHSGG